MVLEAREPLFGARDVGARFLGRARSMQVLQRRAHHRDRRAQLVRQPPGDALPGRRCARRAARAPS